MSKERKEKVNKINGLLMVVTILDKKMLGKLERCHIFTNENWSNIAGNTKNYKNNIYHLDK